MPDPDRGGLAPEGGPPIAAKDDEEDEYFPDDFHADEGEHNQLDEDGGDGFSPNDGDDGTNIHSDQEHHVSFERPPRLAEPIPVDFDPERMAGHARSSGSRAPAIHPDYLSDTMPGHRFLSKGCRARFSDAAGLFLDGKGGTADAAAAKRLFEQVTLELRTHIKEREAADAEKMNLPMGVEATQQLPWNSAEAISSELVDSVRELSVSGAEFRRPEMVKQLFFFQLFWTEALESLLQRDNSKTAHLLLEYGCGNFVSAEDALQCLQQTNETDLYAVDLVLPLLALHEAVAVEAGEALSRLASVEANQETLVCHKPTIDLLLRASKYHFVSTKLQTSCWKAIRTLCFALPAEATKQVLANAGEDDAVYLLFHLLSHHNEDVAFCKEGFQTLAALFRQMSPEQIQERTQLMRDLLDFSFLFLSDLKENLEDGTLLRSASQLIRVLMKKIDLQCLKLEFEEEEDDEDPENQLAAGREVYINSIRKLTYVVATYAKRQEGAVPPPDPHDYAANSLALNAKGGMMARTSSSNSPTKSCFPGNEDVAAFYAELEDIPDVSPVHLHPDSITGEDGFGGHPDSGEVKQEELGHALFMRASKSLGKKGTLPSNFLGNLLSAWDQLCSNEDSKFNKTGEVGGNSLQVDTTAQFGATFSSLPSEHQRGGGTKVDQMNKTSVSLVTPSGGATGGKNHTRQAREPVYENQEYVLKVELGLSLLDTASQMLRGIYAPLLQECCHQMMWTCVKALLIFYAKRERITVEALKNLSTLPPLLLVQQEGKTELIKIVCGKILEQYERVPDVVIYACRMLQDMQLDDTISGKMMKYSMVQRCLRLVRAHATNVAVTKEVLKVLRLLLEKGEGRGNVFLKYGGCEELAAVLRRFAPAWQEAATKGLLIFTFSFLADLSESDGATRRRISLGTGRDTGTSLLRYPIDQQDPELRAQVGDFMRRFEGEESSLVV
ncbi:unnamed protein product [Amoebophrya sp. A25]|nr:unnamed protein product [Amoebophrya sp. A25]|eukprot:GSA25T00022000001.1